MAFAWLRKVDKTKDVCVIQGNFALLPQPIENPPHLLSQLSHDGVDPGEACGGVRPLGERVVVVVPWDLGKIV